MYRKTAALVTIAAAVVVFTQCSHHDSTGPEVSAIGEPISLTVGQSAVVGPEELYVTLESVNFDERCSDQDSCIWPGLAEITIKLRNNKGEYATLDLAISGDTLQFDLRARRGWAFGYQVTLTDLSGSRPESATASLIVRQGDDGNTPVTDKLILIGTYSQKLLGRDVAITDESLAGDTLTLSAHFVGGCVPSYFALFAVDELGSSNGNEIALYLKRVARLEVCSNPTYEVFKFDISALRKFLNIERQEIELKLYGCSNSLAIGPRRLRFPFGNYENRPPVLDPIGTRAFAAGIEGRIAIHATDPDGPRPRISIAPMPANSRTEERIDTTYFLFTPDASQLGWHEIVVVASDGVLADSERVSLRVTIGGVNSPPVLYPIGRQEFMVNIERRVGIYACDPDGLKPSITITHLPDNSRVESASDTTYFIFQPDEGQLGWHWIQVTASDGEFSVFENVNLRVTRDGINSPPVLDLPTYLTIAEADTLRLPITVYDANKDPIAVTAHELPFNAFLRHNYQGNYELLWQPSFAQAGNYAMWFVASDGIEADTAIVFFAVRNVDRAPVIDAPERVLLVAVGNELQFNIIVHDPDNDTVVVSYSDLPATTIVSQDSPSFWSFKLTPNVNQIGIHEIEFVADAKGLRDTALVTIEVVTEINTISFDPIPPQEVMEGDSLGIPVVAHSTHNSYIRLEASALGGLTISRFIDWNDGRGLLILKPGFRSAGVHSFRIVAKDGYDVDSVIVTVTVLEAGDQPPRFSVDSWKLLGAEGKASSFQIPVYDPDGDSVMCTLLDAPVFVEVQNRNFKWYCDIPAGTAVTGEYEFRVLVFALDSAEPTDTIAVSLSVLPVQQNAGSMFPLEVGNYWVYRQQCSGSYCGSGAGIESLAVIGVEIQESDTLYHLRGDLCQLVPSTITLRNGQIYFNNLRLNSLLSSTPIFVLVPAGAFAVCYRTTATFWSHGQDQWIFAPGIGILSVSRYYSSAHYDYGFSYSAELIRYHVGP